MSVILSRYMFWRRLLGKTHAITVYKSKFFYVFISRPKSVRNRCLIELFCGVVCVVTLPF